MFANCVLLRSMGSRIKKNTGEFLKLTTDKLNLQVKMLENNVIKYATFAFSKTCSCKW